MPNQLARIDIEEEHEIANQTRERIDEVLSQLMQLKRNMVRGALIMGDLLLEVKQNNYYLIDGCEDLDSWLKKSSLDIGISEAYYLMRIVTKASAIGIDRKELEKCHISALKEIASLDTETQSDEIRELVAYAQTNTGKKVKEKVDAIKLANGKEIYTLKGFRIPQSVLEEVIEPAIEQLKQEYGQTIDSESGDIIEISDGKALEMICANYLAERG